MTKICLDNLTKPLNAYGRGTAIKRGSTYYVVAVPEGWPMAIGERITPDLSYLEAMALEKEFAALLAANRKLTT